MKKTLICLGLVGLIAFSCDRSDDNDGKKPEVPVNPTPPQNVSASLNVVVNGRSSYENLEIWVVRIENNVAYTEIRQALSQDGKATIDVSKFIGKNMTIQVVDKATQQPLSSITSTIAQNTNNIAMTIANASATLNVVATGRTSYENLEVWVGYRENNVLYIEERKSLSQDGKATIDVSKFIGKNMTIQVVDKTTQAVLANTTRTISRDANNITINVPAQKVYNANISVTKNGVAQANVKVYAVPAEKSALLAYIAGGGSQILKDVSFAITNNNGVATFTNLTTSLLNKYDFVVITQENKVYPYQEGKYQSVNLTLDGTNTAKGEIKIKSTNLKISVSSSKNIENSKVGLYQTSTTPIYTANIKNGKIEISDIAAGTYIIKGVNECLNFSSKTITITDNIDNNINLTATTGGTLTLKNNSSNPYTVTLTHADGTTEKFVMNGGTTKNIDTPVGEAKIYVKQNSGYVLYPTEDTKTSTIKCGESSSVYFP